MRFATYNIRSVRARDWASCWLRRRRALARRVAGIEVDVWAMQEVHASQVRWLARRALPVARWNVVARGRDADGGGEAVPIWWRTDRVEIVHTTTIWFGATPATPGTRLDGARAPRIATLAEARDPDGRDLVVVNTHLDERSARRRHASAVQLAGALASRYPGVPTVVLGDLNCTIDDPELAPLLDGGLVPALAPDAGPTANHFGRRPGAAIDHILASEHWTVVSASVRADAGLVSDHFPVVAELQRR